MPFSLGEATSACTYALCPAFGLDNRNLDHDANIVCGSTLTTHSESKSRVKHTMIKAQITPMLKDISDVIVNFPKLYDLLAVL